VAIQFCDLLAIQSVRDPRACDDDVQHISRSRDGQLQVIRKIDNGVVKLPAYLVG
jgi:hypothetical protein